MNLGRYLLYQVHGRKPSRKPRRRSNGRGPARNWKYRAWIRTLPCAACGTMRSQAAHTGNDGGMSQKASDYSCVPLCPICHREYDNGLHSGAEFERAHGISMRDLVKHLNRLWFGYAGEVK